MKGEYRASRSQLRGYLLEIVILELLKKNGFAEIDAAAESCERVRERREGFIEIKGRGCWHQIDCPCDYQHLIPFSNPLRLLGEVKFFKNPLEKKYIREYIGVIKDIQENYFVSDGMTTGDFYPRKTEIGVYFSANGFQAEAEKLAYAHGIRTVSYVNNYLLDRIKKLIETLEEKYMSVQCMTDSWGIVRNEFTEAVRDGHAEEHIKWSCFYTNDGYLQVIDEIHESLMHIRTSFIGTTVTGVFLHFIGEEEFPYELFSETDEGRCRVHYDMDNDRNLFFWLEISGDEKRRRFYFTPPETLDQAAIYGTHRAADEKERLFRVLNVNVDMNGITRNLTLHIDSDWLDAVRRRG